MPGLQALGAQHSGLRASATRRARIGHDPAHIHRHLEAEQIEEEVARLSGPIG